MSPDPALAPQPSPAGTRGDRIGYGAVHLDVVDLERSLGFWRELIGLEELASPEGEVRLGVGDRALVVLRPGAVRPVHRGHAGLYHLAIHLPDAAEFARVLVRLARANVPQAPTDHIFSKATYLNDPDGIMLELTLETPERYGSIEIGPRTITILDSEGRPPRPHRAARRRRRDRASGRRRRRRGRCPPEATSATSTCTSATCRRHTASIAT